MTKIKTTAKDFFLQALTMVTLYISAVSFGTLLFQLINYAFPDQLFGTFYSFGPMRWAIAALIIAFPIYIVTDRIILKQIKKEPEKKNIWVRQWLVYLTLLAAAIIIIVTLISTISEYLGGEFTVRFGLKVLTILLIAGLIFGYYLYIIRTEKHDPKIINIMLGITSALLLIAVIGSFFVTGGPKTQRAIELDQRRLNDLDSINYQIQDYYRQNQALPASLEHLETAYYGIPVDPETEQSYEYAKTGNLSYELCAIFGHEKVFTQPDRYLSDENTIRAEYYEAGRHCFDLTINPERLKPTVEPVPVR